MAGYADQTEVFQPVATGPPPPQIRDRTDHPVPRLNIDQPFGALATNKFYANFFLGSQTQGVWCHPYSLRWSKGRYSWGMTVSHVEANQRVYGPQQPEVPGNPTKYFINPLGVPQVILSAAELGGSTILTTDSLQAFSANANLIPYPTSSSRITFPLVQGMGFVTAVYTRLQPYIQTGIGFRSLSRGAVSRYGVFKYQLTLQDNTQWLLYAVPLDGQDPQLRFESNSLLSG
ncbi:MAG: hypothetical protein Q9183_006387, partial [Haloplaca sp. 2 TL-2023]